MKQWMTGVGRQATLNHVVSHLAMLIRSRAIAGQLCWQRVVSSLAIRTVSLMVAMGIEHRQLRKDSIGPGHAAHAGVDVAGKHHYIRLADVLIDSWRVGPPYFAVQIGEYEQFHKIEEDSSDGLSADKVRWLASIVPPVDAQPSQAKSSLPYFDGR
jgi:hypothetical protein